MEEENSYKIPAIWNENSRSGFYPKNIQRYVNSLKSKQCDISKHFKIGRLLGRGAFGCVYQAQCRSTGRERAIKITQRINVKLTKHNTSPNDLDTYQVI